MTRIFIVEDHFTLRESLAELIERTDGLELCGQSDSAEGALEQLDEAKPELALIDVSLPGMNGIQLVEAIRQRWPGTCCVLLTGHRSKDYVKAARAAGARGYIEKTGLHDLVKILRGVIAGGTYYPESLTRKASPRPSVS